MAAPQIIDSTFRAQIHTDLKAVLTGANLPKAIHDQRPRVAKVAANLPYCSVMLDDFKQVQAGLRRVTQTYTYEIAFVAALDGVSGVLNTQQIAIANLIMGRLMTGNLYAGEQCVRMVTQVKPGDDQQGADNTPAYEVTLTFEITADATYQ